jgi:hypothetical protein
MVNWNIRIGKRQVDPSHLFDTTDNHDSSSHNRYESRKCEDKMCNAEGRKLVFFVKIIVLKS